MATPEEGSQSEPPPADSSRYYWEADADAEVTAGTQIWHNMHWVGSQLFDGAEFVGEILVEMLGLNRSRYQDIYEMHMAEQERLRAHRLRELEQLRKLRDAEAKALARAAASSSGEHDESEV